MPLESASARLRTRKRAKQACIHCNRRRIRCNVLESQPCQNCASIGVHCEVGISKRGKYPRRKAARQSATPTHEGKSTISDTTVSDRSICQESLWVPRTTHIQPSVASWLAPGDSSTVSQQTVFLRESSPLTCVIHEGRRSPEKGSPSTMQKARLHYPIPEKSDTSSTRDGPLRAHREKVEDQLRADGAFSYPPAETCALLLKAYFTWFHPCFPILERSAVQQAYNRGDLSHLLLQSMLFIGISLCTDADFAQTGFSVRYQAKFLFYNRAKAIFDAGGPSEERDVRFWLGVAIGLAQKRGMHVISVEVFQSTREEKLWKRIWWALYIRDQQSAAALGLPPRIRDDDCDVPMLEPKDIREDDFEENVEKEVFGVQVEEDIVYPVEMTKLARLLRTIVSSQYTPSPSVTNETFRSEVCRELSEWESKLPSILSLGRARSPRATFLTGLLHMTYNNLYILLYRSSFLNPSGPSADSLGQYALDAATKGTRILEDMLSHNLVQHGPTHLITHTFSSLCIHTIHCRRTSGTSRKLAEHRAKLCLMGLQELQKSWDLENWVLKLFFRCLDDSIARTNRLTDIATPIGPLMNQAEDPNGTVANEPTHGPTTGTADPTPNLPISPSFQPSQSAGGGDIVAPSDWYGLFNFTDDFNDVLGAASYDDALNLQNLQFLYRFL
ncbi:Zn(II)2Cys6 transcription factor [Aspergillus avenaceus]|uniref:Zn(II)2Cys6 transcription factor n=1 Tax=Aspergillus avenaceus TaxID=36643 RepID=A0A5N6TPR4_ASPAV|nr:Zn(II)2Cys6 transcription factor [Aspergillus avenaceus]